MDSYLPSPTAIRSLTASEQPATPVNQVLGRPHRAYISARTILDRCVVFYLYDIQTDRTNSISTLLFVYNVDWYW